MICAGCGNQAAVVTKTWFENGERMEVCNGRECGNLTAPWVPDVYFRGPAFEENLGDERNPHGVHVESRRHKASLLRQQGLREDGDRYHGSRDKGVRKKEFKLTPQMEKKRDEAVSFALREFKRKHNAPIDKPLKMVRKK